MPTYRAQVEIPYFTNIPRDVISNTFHFIDFVPQPLADLADDVTPLLQDFYDTIYGVGSRAANHVAWGAAQVNWYDMSQPVPRSPYTLPMPITTTPQTSTLPNEVAICASFQAPRLSGTPQSRRRGRIYLGGFTPGVMQAGSASSFPTLSTAIQTVVNAAMQALKTAVDGTSARWAVWSQVDQAAYLITNGWVNNAPDTQRRRGQDPTVRDVWP